MLIEYSIFTVQSESWLRGNAETRVLIEMKCSLIASGNAGTTWEGLSLECRMLAMRKLIAFRFIRRWKVGIPNKN